MEKDSEKMKILCIGVGGAGTNVINRMKDIGVPNAEFLTFGGYSDDYSHPEIPHYNLIEVNEIDSLPNGSGARVFERLANNVADDIKEVFLYHLNSCKLESDEDGMYSQAMIAQIIKHFHLPNNTVVTDEDVDAILLRSVDEGDGIYDGDVVTIWKYYKKQNTIQEIVTAHPMADLLWYNPDKKHGVTLGIDSVFVASGAMLVPLNPDVVVVNGTIDKMEVTYTFLVDVDARKAILLPSNRGCIGFTSEEGLPICLSFRHHANGDPGRYSVVSVYDEKGNLVKEMSFEDYKKDEEL